MKIVVTGGAGYVGSTSVRMLPEAADDVRVLRWTTSQGRLEQMISDA